MTIDALVYAISGGMVAVGSLSLAYVILVLS